MSDSHDSNEFKIEVAPEDERPAEPEATPEPPSLLLSYLRLCRIPNVFTSFADVAMGYLFVHRGVEHWEAFVTLLAASGFRLATASGFRS